MNIMKLCIPAKINLILSILSLTGYLIIPPQSLFSVIFQAIMVIFWTWVLQYLCSNGYNTIAWVFIILSSFFTISALIIYFLIGLNPPTTTPTTTPTKH